MARSHDVDLPKLVEVMKRDYQALQIYRTNLFDALKEFVGGNYSENGIDNPINQISLFVRIMMGHLAGSDPRMMASTFDREIKSIIDPFKKWANRRLVDMNFYEIHGKAIEDALFLIGIVKTSIVAPAESRFSGYLKAVGEPGCRNIAFQSFCCDTSAHAFSECGYLGDLYNVLVEDVEKNKAFNKKQRLKVVPAEDSLYNEGGDEKIESLGRSNSLGESYHEYARLWEVYMPREGIVVTFDADGDYSEPLLVQDWVGPKCGPYHFYKFLDVPSNLMPKSPIMDLLNMHREQNVLWKKLNNQASRAKTNTAYRDAEDAERVNKAKDGEAIHLNSPDSVNEVVVNSGPNVNVANYLMNTVNTFNEQAGNLRALGGLSSQADTATQEKLVTQSASALVNSMGNRSIRTTKAVMHSLGWFFWHHPRDTMSAEYSSPGVPDIVTQREVTPMQRFGKPYDKVDIDTNPYSYQSPTPQERMMIIDDVVKNFIIPLLPMFNQPGISELLIEAIRLKAEYKNVPELMDLAEKLVGVQGPPVEQSSPEEGASPQQETIHTRVSRPGMTDEGNRQVLQQMMAGGQPPPDGGAAGLGQMSRAS